MAVNGNKKGAKAERALAKWWEKWTGYKFSRTPMSGGWHKNTETTSDLVCVDEKHSRRFPFSVESKSHKEINFNDILKGNKSDILKWWEQCKRDADRGNKIPILFMRENGMKKNTWFVMAELILLQEIHSLNPDFTCIGISLPPSDKVQGRFYVFNSDDIANLSYKEAFYKPARNLLKKNGK